ncbi:MAG TPA: S16 family serine protease, partial [Azonexus sp.]|nr:S16 family serine protease [Azonexus sp.]
VEGDSASLAELCALLSTLAGVGIRQSLAMTGSVNQHGQVQAIGGVNEKIEGFFDICRARGLSGEQGVLIPAANIKHLMLRADVVAACSAGTFHIYAMNTVDQAIELLTGVPAGAADAQGELPEGSVNRLVADKLAHFSALRKAFGASGRGVAHADTDSTGSDSPVSVA